MSNNGFSHIGLTTMDMEKTKHFYESVLGFKAVIQDNIVIEEGGSLGHVFFDVGGGQLLAFLAPQQIPDLPATYDTGINRGLGVPASFYHFAFEAGSLANLRDKRAQLQAKGVEVTEVHDHDWACSFYFRDPNGLSLEYCCLARDLREGEGKEFAVPRAALSLGLA